MDAAQHIVKLGPTAVELVDRIMIDLSLDNPAFRPTIERALIGKPAAILLVEFSGDDKAALLSKLKHLVELMGDLGLPRQRGRDARRRAAEGPVGGAQGGAQHHDEPQGRRQAGELHRGLRGAAASTWPSTPTADRNLRQARHARHLVRARVGRHAARAADPRHASGRAARRRREDARDRRGGVGARAQVQGRVQRRARRRPVPRRMDRMAVRARDQRGVSRDQAQARPDRPVQPRQDHRPAEDGRRVAVPLRAARRAAPVSHDRAEAGARLVGMGRAGRPAHRRDHGARHRRRHHRRLREGRRDVQQQRPLPQVRRRHDVPELPRHARRAAPDARARQHAAARAVGPARARRADQRRDARDARPVRELQGLQARMPDRRRHGAHEDRVPRALQGAPRPHAEGPAGRRNCPTTRARRAACRGSSTCATRCPARRG